MINLQAPEIHNIVLNLCDILPMLYRHGQQPTRIRVLV